MRLYTNSIGEYENLIGIYITNHVTIILSKFLTVIRFQYRVRKVISISFLIFFLLFKLIGILNFFSQTLTLKRKIEMSNSTVKRRKTRSLIKSTKYNYKEEVGFE